jgi:hypothetical protein
MCLPLFLSLFRVVSRTLVATTACTITMPCSTKRSTDQSLWKGCVKAKSDDYAVGPVSTNTFVPCDCTVVVYCPVNVPTSSCALIPLNHNQHALNEQARKLSRNTPYQTSRTSTEVLGPQFAFGMTPHWMVMLCGPSLAALYAATAKTAWFGCLGFGDSGRAQI